MGSDSCPVCIKLTGAVRKVHYARLRRARGFNVEWMPGVAAACFTRRNFLVEPMGRSLLAGFPISAASVAKNKCAGPATR